MTHPDPQAVQTNAWIARPRPAARRRALLADVDEPTVTVVRHRLERAGFEVVVRTNGPDALAAIKEAPLDVVVAASRLPGLDGTSLFEALWESLADPPPVVLVFWPGNAAAVARALDLGVTDVIVRPLSLVETVARIRRAAR